MSFLDTAYHSLDIRVSSNPYFRENNNNEIRSNFKRYLPGGDTLNNVKAAQVCQVTIPNSFYNVTENTHFKYGYRLASAIEYAELGFNNPLHTKITIHETWKFVTIQISKGFYSIHELLVKIMDINNNEYVHIEGVQQHKNPVINRIYYDAASQKAGFEFLFDINAPCWNTIPTNHRRILGNVSISIIIVGATNTDEAHSIPVIDYKTGEDSNELFVTASSPLSWVIGFQESRVITYTRFLDADGEYKNSLEDLKKLIIGDSLINIYPHFMVNLHCDELADYKNFDYKNQSSSCIASFPLTGSFGDVMNFRGNDNDTVIEYETPRPVSSLTFSLRDNKGKVLDTNGCDWFAVIKLFYII